MARQDYEFPGQSYLGWPHSFEMNKPAPAIANRVFAEYADASGFLSDPTACAGIILRVIEDSVASNNGAYLVEKNGEGLKLTKLATGGEATTYSAGQGIEFVNDSSISVKLAADGKLVFGADGGLDVSLGSVDSSIAELDSAIKLVDGSIALLDGSVTAIDGSVAKLDSSIQAIEGDITKLDGSVAKLDSSVAALESDAKLVDGSIALLDGSVKAVESAIKLVDGSIALLDGSVAALESELADKVDASQIYSKTFLDASYTSLTSMVSGAFKFKGIVDSSTQLPTDASNGWVYQVTDASAEYAYDGEKWVELGSIFDLSDYYKKSEIDSSVVLYVSKELASYATDASLKALDSSVKAQDTKLGKLDSSVQSVESAVSKLDASVKLIDGSIAELEGSASKYDSSIKLLDGSVVALDSSVKALDGSLKVVDNAIKLIDGSIALIDGSVAKLDGSVVALDSSVKALESSSSKYDSSIKLLDGSVAKLDSSIQAIEGDINKLDGSVVLLDGSVAKLDSSLQAVESAISKLDASVQAIEAKLSDASIAAWDAAEANVIESIKLNDKDFNIGDSKDASLVIGAGDIKLTGYTGSIATPEQTINEGLAAVAEAIQAAQAGSVASVNGAVGAITIAGDASTSYISIDSSYDASTHVQVGPLRVNPILAKANLDASGNIESVDEGLVSTSIMEDYVNYRLGWEIL